MSCKDCPLKGKVKVPFVGKAGNKIAIIGEAPGSLEEKYQRPFIGDSGQLLFAALDYYCKLERKDVAILNATKCRTDTSNRKETTQALKCCREYVVKALQKIKPKLIVAFGSLALKQILKDGNKITQKSGHFFWSDEFNCWVLAAIHPSYALRNGVTIKSYSKEYIKTTKPERMWADVFKAINSFIKNGYSVKELDTSNYKEATPEDIDEILKHKVVAFDYETNGLVPFDSSTKILSVSFTVEEGKSYVIVFDEDVEQKIEMTKRILTSDMVKVVANRPFEEIWTKVKFGFEVKQPVHDVLTMAHIINEENCQPYSLEEVAKRYAGMQNIKEIAEGMRKNLEDADRSLLIRYNGVDSDATFRAYIEMRKILKSEPRLLNYYMRLTYPAQTMYAKLEAIGMKIDLLYVRELENELKSISQKLHDKLLMMIPKSIKDKYKDNLTLTRNVIIKDYLFDSNDGLKLKPVEFTEKTNQPAITEKHLKNFVNKSAFVKRYLEWKKSIKILNTYFKQIYDSINKDDSKIYPHTFFIATKTGRLAIKRPPLQTIPQRGLYSDYIKRVFKAPEGYYFFDRDLGQSELRIMGWISKCKGIMKALNEGIDLHRNTVNMLFGTPIDKVTKEQRQQAKAINFGFIYGASAKAFQQIAKNDYGVEFTIEEAEELRRKFFKAYPEILDWHKKTLNFARKHGYVESPLGRRRHLEYINSSNKALRAEAERQAINFPIQSFSSDLNLIAQILLQKYLEKHNLTDRIYTLFLVHDAMYGFAKKEYIKDAQLLTKKAMELWTKKYIKRFFGVDVTYPIASEFSYGEDWNNMKEVEDDFTIN